MRMHMPSLQADDGSRKYIQTLEQQMATLAGQKMQLMNQVGGVACGGTQGKVGPGGHLHHCWGCT